MRQIIFMAMLAAGMLMAGCSKDSESKGMEFTISESSISLLAHDDYKITPSGAFTARSSNEDVATVNADGIIHGVTAGEADIIFKSVENPALTQTCKVSVDWRYKYFDEPVLDFSVNLEQLKERETHPFLDGNEWNSTANGFPEAADPFMAGFDYSDGEVPMRTIYTILDKEKGGIATVNLIPLKSGYNEKITQQLRERYDIPSKYKTNDLYFNKKKGYYILHHTGFVMYRTKPLE